MNDEGVNFEMQEKMDQVIQFLHDSIRCVRSTINPSFIETFRISYCGSSMLIKHIANTSSNKGQVLVKPYDLNNLGAIQKVLKEAGFNSYIFSKDTVAVSVPPISGEEIERVKSRIKKLGEESRVSIRSIRKIFRSKIDKTLSEDDQKALEAFIQKNTDEYIDMIDEMIQDKLLSI